MVRNIPDLSAAILPSVSFSEPKQLFSSTSAEHSVLCAYSLFFSSLPDHSQLLSTIGGPCATGCVLLPQPHCGETGLGVRTLCVYRRGRLFSHMSLGQAHSDTVIPLADPFLSGTESMALCQTARMTPRGISVLPA